MSRDDDDDLQLHRAALSFRDNLKLLLPKLLRTRKHDLVPAHLIGAVCTLIEPFQEDPQLLDSHLPHLVTPLVAAYLSTLQDPVRQQSKKGYIPRTHAICFILNLLCKVRGEKVIKGFFNNEPRYLEPLLERVETTSDASDEHEMIAPWKEQYILLLWLSHLFLAPFPLDSLSTVQPSDEVSAQYHVALPPQAPGVVLRVVSVCMQRLTAASKERVAAANLLIRVCVRPDMQKLGLLRCLVQWALDFLIGSVKDQAKIHHDLGALAFLSGLVVSADHDSVAHFVPAIYKCCRRLIDDESPSSVKSSAVARKLVIKILRNLAIHTLRSEVSTATLESTNILEEVIEFLLDSMADSDSPVRYGASKALSLVTLKLGHDMAGDVIEALLGSLNENVYWQGTHRNLSGVNPLRWHGLTLTLSHLLYRKAIPAAQLPEVLNALLLSLSFEQRSPTGGSMGTNVRDAACFGIWALSRRYATTDLASIDVGGIRACEQYKTLGIPQALAIELIIAACLDPAGNIRRGSSAALQELIGRHPNTIEEGIPLVQIVDYHAVGLRQRAMCSVLIEASKLHKIYWGALFEHLLGWRGTGSLDVESRLHAAAAVGLLSDGQSENIIDYMATSVCDQLSTLKPREVEERQGLVSALAALIGKIPVAAVSPASKSSQRMVVKSIPQLTRLWSLLATDLKLEDKAFTSLALRPQLTAFSMLHFMAALAIMTSATPVHEWIVEIPTAEIARVLALCLTRPEHEVLDAVSMTVPSILALLAAKQPQEQELFVAEWLRVLENEASYNGLRCAGHTIALGSAFAALHQIENRETLQVQIVEVLTFRCTVAVTIEARVVALRALEALVQTSGPLKANIERQICSAVHVALNDYTITERGDVGSLVRLEALEVVAAGWTTCTLRKDDTQGNNENIHSDVVRLSLERLDKTRNRASQILVLVDVAGAIPTEHTVQDTSSVSYFLGSLRTLSGQRLPNLKSSTCLGFTSSAGMGSESVLQNSRTALLQFVQELSDNSTIAEVYTLSDFANSLVGLLRDNLHDDRITIPLLEVIAFLLDMQVFQRLVLHDFKFRSLLSLTQKSHFKSSHMHKLHVALDVYRGLGLIPATRADVLTKLTSMLMHPFPSIRLVAAETLWALTAEEILKTQDWSLAIKSLKPAVDGIRLRLSIPV